MPIVGGDLCFGEGSALETTQGLKYYYVPGRHGRRGVVG